MRNEALPQKRWKYTLDGTVEVLCRDDQGRPAIKYLVNKVPTVNCRALVLDVYGS